MQVDLAFSPRADSTMSDSLSTMSVPLSPRDISELTDVFYAFDLDRDGRITRTELAAVLAQLGMPLSEQELEVMMKEADVDGSGSIDLDEFLQINAAAQGLGNMDESAMLKEVFEVFDKDKNGFICAEELHSVLSFLGSADEPVTLEQCRQMIQGVDSNGDGVVDFPEFQKMMCRTDLLPASGFT